MMSGLALVAALAVSFFTGSAAGTLGEESPSPITSPAVAATPQPLPLSKHALRNARLLIEMRLLELRERRLACIRAAILRRLPADLRPADSPPLKQFEASETTKLRRTLAEESEACTWVWRPRERRRPMV
jgi:hypothetical protein